MSAPYKKCQPGLQQLQNAQTASATGQGGILYLGGDSHFVTVVLQSNGTTSGGTLSIEEALFEPRADGASGLVQPYAGTWSVIQSVAASTFSGTAQQVIHIMGASIIALRVRISADITGGGSVTVWAWGN